MLQKANILRKLINGVNRVFQIMLLTRQNSKAIQYHSGGEDYNPPNNIEALSDNIGENPAHSIVFAYKDKIERKSCPGEKRIYATNADGSEVVAEIYLKNDGNIIIKSYKEGAKIKFEGDVDIEGDVNVTKTLKANSLESETGATIEKAETYVSVKKGIVTGGE